METLLLRENLVSSYDADEILFYFFYFIRRVPFLRSIEDRIWW